MVNISHPTSTPASLRRSHRGMALSVIESQPGVSRADLARALGFSEMAATRIVRELLAAGLVEELEGAPSKSRRKRVGRPKTGLRIVPEGAFAVGITVSAYHSEVSISDASGEIRASEIVNDPVFDSAEDAARIYAHALKKLIRDTGIDVDRIVGIGVALSARTDPDRGEIRKSEYFGWSNDGGAFCDEIRKSIDLPIEIENIANALAIAEMRFGAARDAREFALVHAATFVGAGIVSENRVVRGNSGISGLIGHFRSKSSELTCVCGRRDCLNLNATGFAVLSKLGRLDQPAFDRTRLSFYAKSLLDVLADGSATNLVKDASRALAPAVDSIGKLLGSEMIIISGHLGTNPSYFDGVKTALQSDFDHCEDSHFRLVRGKINPERSAALLALHTFFYSDRLDYDRFAEMSERGSAAHG